MPKKVPKKLPSPLQEKLLSLRLKLKAAASAHMMWERLLSDEDRASLGGDLETCWRSMGTVGIWMRLRGVSELRAAVDLGLELDHISAADHKWLLREIGESKTSSVRVLPSWNRDTGELQFGGQFVRRIARRMLAANIVLILDAFQKQGWPDRIDDPLPNGPDKQRLREAVRTLNKRLKVIRFRADGTGCGIVWEVAKTHAAPTLRP